MMSSRATYFAFAVMTLIYLICPLASEGQQHLITASAGNGGSISPSGLVMVDDGDDQSFSITPDPGYYINDVVVDEVSEGATSSYTFSNVKASHSIGATFAKSSNHTISASAGSGGSISPSGDVTVADGGSQSFSITPDPCYHILDVTVDGFSEGDVSSYSFSNVTSDHSISATFAINTYTISASAGSGGSISPSGSVTVDCGSGQCFTVTPDPGYSILDVSVDGSSEGATSSYCFSNVTSNHSISASFEPIDIPDHTISASAGSGGSISPSGDVTVSDGSSQSFSITPNPCYRIADVTVDGSSIGATASYSFSNVTSDHSISATFEGIIYTMSASAGSGGSISPSGGVICGSDGCYTITPDPCYHIVDVIVDGSSVGAMTSYCFYNVTSDHSISATFAINTYTISASAGDGGSISPSGDVTVDCGSDECFTMTPDPGYRIADVSVDGSSVGAVTSYCFSNVTSDHSISASFEVIDIPGRTISASAGSGGSISPSGDVTVADGDSQTFSITPDGCYHIADVLVDSVSVGAVSEYTFSDVTSDHTIDAEFTINTYTISASAGTGGSISPSGSVTVDCGSGQSFSIAPDDCYHVADVVVDGESMGAVGEYTFADITSNHTINVTFALDTYNIAATSEGSGSISPSGSVTVDCGSSQTFTMKPDDCYRIADVLVDGSSVGAISEYIFANVTSNHTIDVIFITATYTIAAEAGDNGSIWPSGEVTIDCGSDQTFTMTPDSGYRVKNVVVDELSVGDITAYTFTNVTSSHTISVEFERRLPEIVAIRDSTGGMPQKAQDVITVTVIQESDSELAESGEFDIGNEIKGRVLYNDGTNGDLLSDDNIWTGQYKIEQGDDVSDAPITARLYALGEAVEKSVEAGITIDTVPPSISSVVCDPDPTGEGEIVITVTFVEERSGMSVYAPFSVSFVTPGGKTVAVYGSYTSKNLWQGTGRILKSHQDGKATVIIHGGQDRAGNPLLALEIPVIFQIDIVEEIEWVEHDATAPLKAGDVLKVLMKGQEGKEAFFGIDGLVAGEEMNEIDSGIYEGSYTVQAGDNVEDAKIRCRLGDVEEMAYAPVTIDTTNPGVDSVLIEPTLAKTGTITVNIAFAEEMDMAVEPVVTYMPANTGKSILVDGEYRDEHIWHGTGIVNEEMENGPAKIVISGAQDIANNPMELYEEPEAFIIDTIPPAENQAKVAINNGAGYTNNRSLNITWSGFADDSGIDGYYYSFTDGSGTPNGAYAKEPSGNLIVEGDEATVYVWAKDRAGNIGNSAYSSVIIDSDPPTVAKVTVPEIVKAGPVTVSVQFHDNGAGMSDDPTSIRVEIRVQDGLSIIQLDMKSFSDDGLWIGSGTVADGTSDDAAILAISGARDNSGNKMIPNNEYYFAIDALAPAPPADFTATPGPDGLIKFSWERSAAPDALNYRIRHGDEVLKGDISESSTSWEYKMEDGLYTFSISAVDRAGNESKRVFSPFVEADSTAPEDVTNFAAESLAGARISLSWTASTSTDVQWYEITYNGEDVSETDTTWTSKQLEDGKLYTFVVRAVDEVGNKSNGRSVSELAIDNDPPTVTVEDIGGDQHSDVPIKYHLNDRERENLGIICEYGKAEDNRWYTASIVGKTEDIANYSGSIIWDSRADIPSTSGMDVRFRITPKDDQQEGKPYDSSFYLVNILGDYNDDERVDDADLDIFREVWDDQDIRRELGPATGAPPDLVPYPDGVIDFEDLVVFGLMWMWSTDKHAIAPAPWVTSASQAGTPSYLPKLEIGNDHVLNISIPTDGLMGCISLEYDANIISISPLEQFSGSNMTFLSDIEHPGHIALAFVDLGLVKDKGRTSTFAANLDWKAKADDVQIVFHYDMRDLQNRTIAMGTEIRTIRHLPQANALLQNYPNPFNPDTWIPFRLAEDADVTIRIYNSLGQLVRGLDLGHRTAGFYTSKERAAHWDGKNESGENVSSGIYLYRLGSASRLTTTRKMVIVR